jgi:hypothetical protein
METHKTKGRTYDQNALSQVRPLRGTTWSAKNCIGEQARREAVSEHACREFSIECKAKAFLEAIGL